MNSKLKVFQKSNILVGGICLALSTLVGSTAFADSYPPTTIALTSIPYTGFDEGPLLDALYWLLITAVALCGAYLIVYFKGGAVVFFKDIQSQFFGSK